MLQFERRQNILEILRKKHSVSIKELAALVYTSEASVRRDIQRLEAEGIVERIYGGVVLSEYKNEVVPVKIRETANSVNKEKIAVMASKMINDGDTVMLDSSSTACRICKHILTRKNLKVITNNLRVCNELKDSDIEIYLVGGLFSNKRECFTGNFTENFIKSVHGDILFFSATGISETGEITDVSEDEINLRRLMMKQSKKRVFLCDKTKLGKISTFKLCEKDDIDVIICDEEIQFKEDER